MVEPQHNGGKPAWSLDADGGTREGSWPSWPVGPVVPAWQSRAGSGSHWQHPRPGQSLGQPRGQPPSSLAAGKGRKATVATWQVGNVVTAWRALARHGGLWQRSDLAK